MGVTSGSRASPTSSSCRTSPTTWPGSSRRPCRSERRSRVSLPRRSEHDNVLPKVGHVRTSCDDDMMMNSIHMSRCATANGTGAERTRLSRELRFVYFVVVPHSTGARRAFTIGAGSLYLLAYYRM